MAKVENPQFTEDGPGCFNCPLDYEEGKQHHTDTLCSKYIRAHRFNCPRDMEEYAEACKLAEQEAAK